MLFLNRQLFPKSNDLITSLLSNHQHYRFHIVLQKLLFIISLRLSVFSYKPIKEYIFYPLSFSLHLAGLHLLWFTIWCWNLHEFHSSNSNILMEAHTRGGMMWVNYRFCFYLDYISMCFYIDKRFSNTLLKRVEKHMATLSKEI